jgi:Fe-S cluster assembly protein SufD
LSETVLAVAAPRPGTSRDAVERLSRARQEPEWLLALRLRALEAFERLPMPDQRTEGWRRTNLRGLSLDGLAPTSESVCIKASAPAIALPLDEAVRDARLAPVMEKHFGQLVAFDADKFVALHYALFNAGAVVVVPRGRVVDEPIDVTYSARAAGPVLAHTLLVLEDEANLPALVENFSGAPGLSTGVVEQVLGANAHTRYVQLQRFGDETWSFSTQRAHLGPDASFRTLNVALGSRVSRAAVQIVLEGRGSQADLLGIVDLAGRQHTDFQTLQEHRGDATRSDLVIHDALRDRSSANFTGLIRIDRSAHQTESSQEQKNILLSDSAKADSDPKLEILNNDVIRCTHGAAVGPVDEEMVFYLQSRGLDRASAEQLIVEGFFQSTLGKLGVPSVQETVWSAISESWSRL